MIIGILLFSIGALILLTQLLGANFLKLLSLYWPTLLILYGALRLLTDKHRHNFPLFLMAFGAILQAYKLQLFRGNILLILIALCLILLGLRIIINRFSQRHTNYNENVFTDDDDHQQKGTYGYEERDMLNDRFLFADAHRVYRSDSFSGGTCFKRTAIYRLNAIGVYRERTLFPHIQCDLGFIRQLVVYRRDALGVIQRYRI